MFGFFNLNAEILAQFWIYCIGSLVVGVIIGWSVNFFLSKRERNILNSEKNLFETEKASFTDIKIKYEALRKDYEALNEKLEMNEEYWLYKKKVPESHDVDPSELLKNGLLKRET